jgi:hypothetical protein
VSIISYSSAESECGTYTTLVASDSLCKGLRTLIDDNVPPTILAWLAGIDDLARIIVVSNDRNHRFCLQTRLSCLTHNRRSIDSNISEVSEQFLSSVLGLNELE